MTRNLKRYAARTLRIAAGKPVIARYVYARPCNVLVHASAPPLLASPSRFSLFAATGSAAIRAAAAGPVTHQCDGELAISRSTGFARVEGPCRCEIRSRANFPPRSPRAYTSIRSIPIRANGGESQVSNGVERFENTHLVQLGRAYRDMKFACVKRQSSGYTKRTYDFLSDLTSCT